MLSHLGAVVGTAGEGNFEVKIVWENGLLNAARQCGGVVAGKGAHLIADAGTDIAGAGGGVTAAWRGLVDAKPFDQRLQRLVDFGHFIERNAGNLKALTQGDVHGAVAIGLCDAADGVEVFGIHAAAGHTHAGGSEPTVLGHAKGVLFERFGIRIHE